jgi:hypothetical protein
MSAPQVLPDHGIVEKEPLVTGHRNHDEMIEELRINQAARSMHRIPLAPQAMIYLLIIMVIGVAALLTFVR